MRIEPRPRIILDHRDAVKRAVDFRIGKENHSRCSPKRLLYSNTSCF